MVVLSSQFILLHAVFQNILYIHQPLNSTDAFVCFNKDMWVKMSPDVINNIQHTFSTAIPPDATRFRIKINISDNVTKELDWMSTREPYITENSKEASVIALLCYLTLCSSILLLKCIIRIIIKRNCLLMVN